VPVGLPGTDPRVVRGGSWNNNRENARCAYRNHNHPDNRNNNIGFRVVRVSHIRARLRRPARSAEGWQALDAPPGNARRPWSQGRGDGVQ
jgi:Sulfatase-modifying factor enzyme 1